ncbi:MAG: 30S ribosomal protein S8 [Candidatus Paceibacterota bacterium]
MDTLGDMLIQIKNAGNAGRETVMVSYSHFKNAVAEALLREGYVSFVNKKTRRGFKVLEIGIVFEETKPKIKGLERVSKLSRRIYFGVNDIIPVKQGYGSLFLSTPKGILTGKQARKDKVGGEALFKVW